MPLKALGKSGAPRPPEKLPGALALSGSVGFSGANQTADVLGVQASLNQVMPSFGGPLTPLKEDGIAGPKTQNAILRFQTFWVQYRDSKIEPGRSTVFALNRAVGAGFGGTLPSGPAAGPAPKPASGFTAGAAGTGAAKPATATQTATGATGATGATTAPTGGVDLKALGQAQFRLINVKGIILPDAYQAAIEAVRVATRASAHAQRLPLPNVPREDPDRLAFLLVAKHFKLHERDPAGARTGTAQVELIARRMAIVLVNRVGKPIPGVPPGSEIIISLWRTPASVAGHPAYTWYGGMHERHRMLTNFHGGEGNSTAFKPDYADRIYLTPEFDHQSPIASEFQSQVIIHELAHFTGDMVGGPRTIDDLGYSYEAKYQTNTSAQRLANAEAYALFVREAGFGTYKATTGAQLGLDYRRLGKGPTLPLPGITPVIHPPLSGLPDPFKYPSGGI